MSLDPRENYRLQKEIEAANEKPDARPLNPPFPYRPQVFQPDVFGVLDDPPENESGK